MNAKSLLDCWNELRSKPYTKCGARITDVDIMYRDNDMDDVLLLLKCFPVQRQKFEHALSAFMVYSDVSLLL